MADDEKDSELEAEAASVRQKHPNRDVLPVVLKDEFGEYRFVLSSPTSTEWNKYQIDVEAARGSNQKSASAAKNAVLAQIRWPARDIVEALLDRKPAMVLNLIDPFHRLAGVSAEERKKN